MSQEKSSSDRQEELEKMLEDYDGPSLAEYAGETKPQSSTQVSNSLKPPEKR